MAIYALAVFTVGVLGAYSVGVIAAVPSWMVLPAGLAFILGMVELGAVRARVVAIMEGLEETRSAIAIYDAGDRLIYANRSYAEMLNVPLDMAMPGRHYAELTRAGLQKSVTPDMLEAELDRRLVIHRRADGIPTDRRYSGDRWLRVTKSRAPSGNNVGIALDVTTYYELQRRLQTEVRRFTALANAAPVGICQLDEAGSVQFMNPALQSMLSALEDQPGAAPVNFEADDVVHTDLGSLLCSLSNEETEVTVQGGAHKPRHLLVKKAAASGQWASEAQRSLATVDVDGNGPEAERVRNAKEDDGTAERLLIFVDITERKKAEAKIRHLVLHDALTGARNRIAFGRDLANIVEGATADDPAVLIAIDLDRFKPVNDEHGHSVGDELLCAAVKRIEAHLDPEPTLYRLGGDEFAILVARAGREEGVACAHGVLASLDEPFHLRDLEISVRASIGLSVIPDDTRCPDTLVDCADRALYAVKRAGGNDVQTYADLVGSESRATSERPMGEATAD